MGLWVALGVLALAGILDTIYVLRFTFAPDTPGALAEGGEAACAIDDPGHCQTLFKSPTARLIGGIPNSALGFLFYGAIVASTILSLAGVGLPHWWIWGLMAGAMAAVAMSVYLLYHLLVVRRTTCIPCFIGQALNLLILIGLFYV